MSRKFLWISWGALFAVCAVLGIVPHTNRALGICSSVCSFLFFLPPAGLLRLNIGRDRRTVGELSWLSLGITTVTLIVNILLAARGESLGNFLHFFLAVISTPMFSFGWWAVSLFFWACLGIASRGKK